ncbi:sigma-70 family RNA polymerase sigma factor [Metabacillus malikii]|uniref:RNA polymerase sigma-70 factor (ECF subfamily) n=1 Tax=Metabacillus malikii TaxID=1504265 RepID=A0ABT9ZML0_9BACI|nr:sigma-70 family RNA polymerase sigma factor [Metabacillus malikii]MDQ0233489.1 RNA polymerase sigma-70 factor (ECF subfamily) [Metabacillus malikii]
MREPIEYYIKRLKKQKEDGLEAIVDTYMPFVKAIAENILSGKNRSALDECVNDVFLSVWQNANKFTGDGQDFKKWIGMITKSKAIDLYRQLEKQQARQQDDRALEKLSGDQDIQTKLILAEQKNELLFEISKLDELDREIMIMKYFLELSNLEIAESLELTKAAVDNRLYRGKKKLASAITLKERFV